MLKAYVSRWKKREKPEEHIVDYWFCPIPEGAASWGTREEAENDRAFFNQRRIIIPSSQGGTYACRDFEVEERAPGEFVIFCMAPFTARENVSVESTAK